MSGTWMDELWNIVCGRWSIGERFTLTDIMAYENHFARLYPSNRFVAAKLRQTLQYLRDEERIEFVDDLGTYKRLM